MMRNVRRTKRRPKVGAPWNADDVAVLTELYPTCNNRDLAAKLGRSEWAISGKARNLGLAKDHEGGYQRALYEGRHWSKEETELLRKLYPTLPDEEIAEQMGRSRDAVHMKARRLRLRKLTFWSEQEDQFLREMYRACSCSELAQRLGRSVLAVKTRIITLKLAPKVPNWTQSEIRLLREAYGTMSPETIAAELGRTGAALAKKAREIGLVRCRRRTVAAVTRSRVDDGHRRLFDSVDQEMAPSLVRGQKPVVGYDRVGSPGCLQ